MHAALVAAGPGIRHQDPVANVRAIDLAPTLAFLLGIPGPQNARGRILTNLVPKPGQYKEVTILDISDYHGQLIPLSEAADTVCPSFGISGHALPSPPVVPYPPARAHRPPPHPPRGPTGGATPPS